MYLVPCSCTLKVLAVFVMSFYAVHQKCLIFFPKKGKEKLSVSCSYHALINIPSMLGSLDIPELDLLKLLSLHSKPEMFHLSWVSL